MPIVALMTSCEADPLKPEDVFTDEASLEKILQEENPEGYDFYNLNDFLDAFMTEEGTYHNDTTPYRERSYDATHGLYLYSVDTIRHGGRGIYIRGRVATDDFAGNFYKALVIQQIVEEGGVAKQQTLRISVDLGSSGGLYQIGQEIIIRCNGLSVGRYANQPQLCVPSYNNNIYAMTASEKVGWCPGRIPVGVFRNAVRLIGTPDQSKLQYDELTLAELFSQVPVEPALTKEGMDQVRKADGRLVIIKDVFFSGLLDDNGTIKQCEPLHPDSSGIANVFAPTTKNIGYPQSRMLCDLSANIADYKDKKTTDISAASVKKSLMCSNSEYAKFAYYYLPGANKEGVANCPNYQGTVKGILGWYQDKASVMAQNKLDGYEWSVTPRGIPGIGIEDILMKHKDTGDDWVPQEFDPRDYQ